MSKSTFKQETLSLEVELGPLRLKNPVLTASGTCGYGEELADWMDLSSLGAVVTKTVTRQPRAGNPSPRTCETPSGMLNAIGLQNVGVERFIEEKLPFLHSLGVSLIVNIAGETVEDFANLAKAFNDKNSVNALELNISCPNVAHGLDFATDPHQTKEVLVAVRDVTDLPIIAKLSPNVTDIRPIALAAQEGGADILSMTNTFIGMAIDIELRRPVISNLTGGLSGPAIKPLSLLAVYHCAQTVDIPIIGIGGIANAADAIEYLLAGASAVQVGTATFVQPDAASQVLRGIEEYMQRHNIKNVQEIVGALQI
ncbi:MAG: dihydroorotate dehydrogenase [Abditibacteriaceae bacterium]